MLAAAALALAPLAAEAQSYRCVGKDGKKYYGQSIPPQCLGLPVEQLNAQGVVVRRIEPQASAPERGETAAEAEERKKREAALKEESRRNKALLATYTSERDIESARARALEDNQKAVKEIEARIAALKKRQGDLTKELEFFKGKNKPPAKLEQDIRNAEIDLKAQEGLLAAKKKEVDSINAKYDDDKKRYIELTRGSAKK
jgi:chromosome segregation ATPase